MTELRYSYFAEGPELRFMARNVLGRWRSLTELFAIAVMLIFLYLIVSIAIREMGTMFGTLHPGFASIAPMIFWAGIVLGLAAAYLTGLLVGRLQSAILDSERGSFSYKTGPIAMRLSAEGITSETVNNREVIRWPAVQSIRETPQGIALRLDASHFVPVPDHVLPDGLEREQVLTLIRRWRSGD